MITVRRLTALTLVALAIAGCGGAPNRAKAPKTPTRAVTGGPGFMPMNQGAMPAPGQDQGKGAQLLARVRQGLNDISGFEGELLARTQGYYKQGQKQDELRKVTVGYKITWMKPSKFRGEVTQAPDALMEGAAIVTTDGDNLTARAKGVLGLVPIKIKSTEPKLSNARNHKFADFRPDAQIQRLIGPTAVWTVIGEMAAPNGVPMALVAIDNVKRLDREITREVLGIELQSLVLRSLTAYAGDVRATDYTFNKFRWNPKVSSETFKI